MELKHQKIWHKMDNELHEKGGKTNINECPFNILWTRFHHLYDIE